VAFLFQQRIYFVQVPDLIWVRVPALLWVLVAAKAVALRDRAMRAEVAAIKNSLVFIGTYSFVV
jgi:hypothetical protein